MELKLLIFLSTYYLIFPWQWLQQGYQGHITIFFPYSFDLIVHSLKQMLWLQLMETEIIRYVNSIQWKLLVFTFLLTNNETSMCIQCWRLEHHTETVAEKDSCFGVWNVSNVVWICFCGGIFLLKLINLWNSLKFFQTKKRGH